MTTWYNATAGIVEAANNAMAEIASGFDRDDAERRIHDIWEDVANALLHSEPDFDQWPELKAQADEMGDDYVGVTSDTRQVVRWGEEHWFGRDHSWREFVILSQAAPISEGYRIGDRVEDYDTGRVVELDGARAYVAWDSGVRTWTPISDLRDQQ